MNSIFGKDLHPQIHISWNPVISRAQFLEVSWDLSKAGMMKPSGGLWTSSLVEDDTGWCRWCRVNEFDDVDAAYWHRLTPMADATVLAIDSFQDYIEAVRSFPIPLPWDDKTYEVDFEKVRDAGYSGVHLTESGLWDARMPGHPIPLGVNYISVNGWDCESTVWLKWAFEEVGSVIYRSPRRGHVTRDKERLGEQSLQVPWQLG